MADNGIPAPDPGTEPVLYNTDGNARSTMVGGAMLNTETDTEVASDEAASDDAVAEQASDEAASDAAAVEHQSDEDASDERASDEQASDDVVCAETQAYLDAMDIQPDYAHVQAIDDFIRALIAGGVWAKNDCLYLLAAQTQQASQINARSPGYKDLTRVTYPDFIADFGVGGGTGRLSSGWNISDGPNAARGDVGVFTFLETLGNGRHSIAIGAVVPSPTYQLATGSLLGSLHHTDPNTIAIGRIDAYFPDPFPMPDDVSADAITNMDPCMLVLNRYGTTDLRLRRNTVEIASNSAASVTNASLEVAIEGWGVAGASRRPMSNETYPTGYFYPGYLSLAGFGAALSSAESDVLVNAWATYRTAVGVELPSDVPSEPPSDDLCAENFGYDKPGGTGDRTGQIVASLVPPTLQGIGEGTAGNLIDGGFGSNSTDAMWWSTGPRSGVGVDAGIEFDFSVIGPQVIKKFKWYQDTTNNHGEWQLQRWDPIGGEVTSDEPASEEFPSDYGGPNWVNVGPTFTLGGAATTEYDLSAYSNAGSIKWALRWISGTKSGAPWLREIEFYLGAECGADVPDDPDDEFASEEAASDERASDEATSDAEAASDAAAEAASDTEAASDEAASDAAAEAASDTEAASDEAASDAEETASEGPSENPSDAEPVTRVRAIIIIAC